MPPPRPDSPQPGRLPRSRTGQGIASERGTLVLFPTVEFAIYFPIVLALSWALMPHLQWWKIFIVVASYVFYGTANWKFCFLLGGVTLGNHLFARLIARAPEMRRKKQLLG